MKRIKQLLAKGIDNLEEPEKVELLNLLTPEKLAELTDAELIEIRDAVRASADALIEDDDTSPPVLQALNELANILDVIEDDKVRRENEAADADAAKAALRERIRGVEEVEEEAPEDDGLPRDDVDENGEPIVVIAEEVVTEPVAVAAGVTVTGNSITAGTSAPSITRVAARRPADRSPRSRGNSHQAAITAASNVPGVQAGMRLDTDMKLFQAFDSAVRLAQGSNEGSFSMPVMQLRSEIPDELQLDRDVERNERIIEARSGMSALTASGGACAPVPYSYDLTTVGDDIRPVRDALARYGAQRAGVSLFTPPTITDVSGTGATTAAVSEWTYANDVTPGSDGAATKPYLRINCGSNTPTTTRVNAIVTQYESGNMLERWYPELIQAYVRLIAVYGARFAEAKNLAGIAAGSKVISHGQVLGSASDIFPALDQLFVGMRYRHRISSAMPMRVIGFEWVKRSIITDLIRRGAADRPLEERLAMADSQINSWFAARNVNVTWSPDYQFGVNTIGAAGGPVAGVQNPGPAVGFPSIARFYVFMEGAWLFLDGGEFRVGVMRDVTLVRKNDWMFFSETFENVAYHGVPGESYVYDMDICANGGYSSPLDISPCVTNS